MWISTDIFISFFLTEISVLFLFDTLMSPLFFNAHTDSTPCSTTHTCRTLHWHFKYLDLELQLIFPFISLWISFRFQHQSVGVFLIRILKIHSEKFTETAVIWMNFPWFASELVRSLGVVFAWFSKHPMPVSYDGNSFLKSVPTYLPEKPCSPPLQYVWSPSLSELLLLLLG